MIEFEYHLSKTEETELREEVITALSEGVRMKTCFDRSFRTNNMIRPYYIPDLLRDCLILIDGQAQTLTLEEVKAYVDGDESNENPLWLEWSTDAIKGGWVLPYMVNNLVWKLESVYQVHWVLWTRKPTEDQRKAVIWKCA